VKRKGGILHHGKKIKERPGGRIERENNELSGESLTDKTQCEKCDTREKVEKRKRCYLNSQKRSEKKVGGGTLVVLLSPSREVPNGIRGEDQYWGKRCGSVQEYRRKLT